MAPDEWQNTLLGDCCKVQGGFAFKSKDFTDSGVPVIRISNIKSGGIDLTKNTAYLPESYLPINLNFVVKKGDILMALSGATTGKFGKYQSETPVLFNQRVGRFKVLYEQKLHKGYLYQILHGISVQVLEQAYGAAQPNISTKDLERFPLLLPLLPEQKKIAAILTSVDDTIQATQAIIDQTRRVKQGLIQQLLTRGIGHTQFKQTEIGEIPEGWAIVKLGDVANESKERFIPNGNEIYTYVGLEHMKSGINRIARTGLSSDVTSSKTVFKVGDTLFGKLRPYLKKVALSDIFGVCSTDIIAIRPSEQIDPYFLCAVLSSDSAISHSIESSAGTKMPRTSWKEMSNFNVLLPKIIEQKKIAAVLKSLDEVLQIEQTKLQQNIKIKRGLMQDLLTGSVRVKLDGEATT